MSYTRGAPTRERMGSFDLPVAQPFIYRSRKRNEPSADEFDEIYGIVPPLDLNEHNWRPKIKRRKHDWNKKPPPAIGIRADARQKLERIRVGLTAAALQKRIKDNVARGRVVDTRSGFETPIDYDRIYGEAPPVHELEHKKYKPGMKYFFADVPPYDMAEDLNTLALNDNDKRLFYSSFPCGYEYFTEGVFNDFLVNSKINLSIGPNFRRRLDTRYSDSSYWVLQKKEKDGKWTNISPYEMKIIGGIRGHEQDNLASLYSLYLGYQFSKKVMVPGVLETMKRKITVPDRLKVRIRNYRKLLALLNILGKSDKFWKDVFPAFQNASVTGMRKMPFVSKQRYNLQFERNRWNYAVFKFKQYVDAL